MMKVAGRTLTLVAFVMISVHAVAASTETKPDNPLLDTGSWSELYEDFVGDTAVMDGNDLFTVEAPYRAEDAAIVPVRIQAKENTPAITAAKLIIDENPAPLAAEFIFGEAMSPLNFETRIRVNRYSNVRVISQVDDGLYMNGRYVKASGGCSAPATKDPESAMSDLGLMRLRQYPLENIEKQVDSSRRTAQLMVRHPNHSGLQRNQATQLAIPAFFIHHLEVHQGDDLLFAMEGGISISENPVFRFDYKDNGSPNFTVKAVDTKGNKFETVLAKAGFE